ncbi:hypothetical protein, partial [Terrabacter terrae]|uniref:hypothetical protein n=1 Tax=Terrabacter terrae TaxID=318434 RepID=UPI0031CFAD7B
GATAASINLIAISPQKGGYLSAGATAGTASWTVNFTPGQTVANLLVTRLSSTGTITVFNHSSGTIHVVADLTSYLR